MSMPRRTAVISFLVLAVVLCLLITFRSTPGRVPMDSVRMDFVSIEFGEGRYENVIGIDLGRTFSRAGIFSNDSFEIFKNDQVRSAVPSYVAFTNQGSTLTGFTAKDQADSNHQNTVYDVSRLIGRKFSGPELQGEVSNLPYDVVEKNGRLFIRIQINGAVKDFTPEQISSKMEHLKDLAEAHLKRAVKYAVITVPSYFDDDQRQATKEAAESAGLYVVSLIDEAKAALMAYTTMDVSRGNWDFKECAEGNFIVCNLGAKESSLALASVDRDVFESLALANNRSLGGDDFENALPNHHITQFSSENTIDTTKDSDAMKELKYGCVKADHSMSRVSSAKTETAPHHRFSRSSMATQQSITSLSGRSLKLVNNLLVDAKIQEREVHGLIGYGR